MKYLSGKDIYDQQIQPHFYINKNSLRRERCLQCVTLKAKPTVVIVLLLLKPVSFPIHLPSSVINQITVKREKFHQEKATQKSTSLETQNYHA